MQMKTSSSSHIKPAAKQTKRTCFYEGINSTYSLDLISSHLSILHQVFGLYLALLIFFFLLDLSVSMQMYCCFFYLKKIFLKAIALFFCPPLKKNFSGPNFLILLSYSLVLFRSHSNQDFISSTFLTQLWSVSAQYFWQCFIFSLCLIWLVRNVLNIQMCSSWNAIVVHLPSGLPCFPGFSRIQLCSVSCDLIQSH